MDTRQGIEVIASARKKIADAVVNGKILQVEGCEATGQRSCGMRRRMGCEQNDVETHDDQTP